MSTMQREFRLARSNDRSFIVDLCDQFSEQLSFLPYTALDQYLKAGLVMIAQENECPAGYILCRNRLNSARWCRPIVQTAVCFDAQRRQIGLDLMEQVITIAKADLMEGLQCWVAEEIEARAFFRAAGFVDVCRRRPENRRKRELVLMRKNLNLTANPDFWKPPRVAGCHPRLIQPIISLEPAKT